MSLHFEKRKTKNFEKRAVQVAHMVIEDHLITELKIDNTRICEKTKAGILSTVNANAQNGPKNPRKNASTATAIGFPGTAQSTSSSEQEENGEFLSVRVRFVPDASSDVFSRRKSHNKELGVGKEV